MLEEVLLYTSADNDYYRERKFPELKRVRKMVYNFSKDSEYHTQINNKIVPEAACNTTSMIMALKQAGHIPFFTDEGAQPEDELSRFLLYSTASSTRMKYRYPWYYEKKIPATEIHEMLEWGINYMMTWDIDRFSMKVDIETIIEKLQQKCGIVLSGLFPVNNTNWGHIVSLAGFVTTNEDKAPSIDNISHFIIDDPRGEYRTDYQDMRGNNVRITKNKFMDIFKDTKSRKNKWAHIIRPPSEHEYRIQSGGKY